MTVRKPIVVLAAVVSLFIVSCESEQDPGGNGGLGYMGDTTVNTSVDEQPAASEGGY